ncbi:MAG TPA: DUF2939 domain-containing protein [Trinickia sp.]|uniref:DUF2939 domain-containing protein n=1 Tax=Trinickia sp. TaxID=2571163 RepID=UPI002F421B8C
MMNDQRSPGRRHRLVTAVAVLVAVIVLGVVALAYASPYLVLDRLKRAADARNAEIVNRYVDYPALRTSLKQQVTEMLARRIDEQKREHPFAALGALVGMALIGPLVDAYATPDGVAALLNGLPPRGEPGETPPQPGAQPDEDSAASGQGQSNAPAPAPAPTQPPRASAGYDGIDQFVVTYRRDAQSRPYSVLLRRDGWFSWKLFAVNLNQ